MVVAKFSSLFVIILITMFFSIKNFLGKRKNLLILSIIFVSTLVFINSFVVVEAGYSGVKTRFGEVIGGTPQGLIFKLPFIDSVEKIDIRVQKSEVNSRAASKDLQNVSGTIALNYHLEANKTPELYQEVGIQYADRIIAPVLQESFKSTTAQFTADELITKRELVKDTVRQKISDRLTPYGIIVDDLNIVDFDFSQSFNKAIEAKVTAEQDALAARNKLQQVQFEAEQKIAEAKGKAEAIKIESEALRNNPDVLNLRAIEKWDGKLPQVTNEAIPFINIGR